MPIPTIVVEGNLTADPEYRTTQSGKTVANVRVAANESRRDERTGQWEQVDACFLNVVCWPPLSDNMQATGLVKGSPVIVAGRLRTRQWQDEQGQPHSRLELAASSIGPDLRRGVAQFRKTGSGAGSSNGYAQGAPSGYRGGASATGAQAPAADPWGQPIGQGQTFGAPAEFGGDEGEPAF
ncbi:single-stranded DNA-binding protein [Bifidobacterium pseudolongum]|uniref:Single-stranded DNA-binding protein n=1 Tax=Bifidobacterium pseudolongum subsp. globosum TaxID=1690 RepID=A0A4Q5AT79_9BIFI|nr:single-stranded DNA-binding protein [Bifidobacterium pseudolongum]RYQ36316.1 single-stranded DNA-binding protein [Bifidobacterium pseudolongum subsp. globosum]